MFIHLLSGQLFAAGVSPRPVQPAAVVNECSRSYAIRAGQKLPDGLVDAKGIAKCSANAVPTSEALHLVKFEVWADELYGELAIVEVQRDWYKTKYETPEPWWKSPQMQRTRGQVEVLAVAFVVAYGFNALQSP